MNKEEAEKVLNELKNTEYDGKKVLKPYIEALESQIKLDLPEIKISAPIFATIDAYKRDTESNFVFDALFNQFTGLSRIKQLIEAYTDGVYSSDGVKHDAETVVFRKVAKSQLETSVQDKTRGGNK